MKNLVTQIDEQIDALKREIAALQLAQREMIKALPRRADRQALRAELAR